MAIVKRLEEEQVLFSAVVNENNLVLPQRPASFPGAIASNDFEAIAFTQSGELLVEQPRPDEIPAWLARVKVFVSVKRVLADDPQRRNIERLHEAPERRCDGVAELLAAALNKAK